MRTYLHDFILILCCLFIIPTANAQLEKIYLHPKAAGSEKQSKFVDSIRFIPLEVKEDVELTMYNQVDITNDYFLIKDYVGRAILLYAKTDVSLKK